MTTFTDADLSEGTVPPGSLSKTARSKLRAQVLAFRSLQQQGGGSRTDLLGMCQQAGTLRACWFMTEEAYSAGESCTIDVVQAKTGLSILVAPVLVSGAAAKEIQLAIPLSPAALVRAQGDTFEVRRVYVPGGSPNDPPGLLVLEWA